MSAGPWVVTCTGCPYWYIRRSIPTFPGSETVVTKSGRTKRFKTAKAAKEWAAGHGIEVANVK